MQASSKTLLFILLSFLLGGVGGLVVGKSYYGRANKPRPSREDIRKEFTERLRLDAHQRAAVDSILEFHRSKFGEMRKRYSERFKAHRDTLRWDTRKVLSPEQNKLYDEFIKEMDEREGKERERRGRE
ncbi:MAG: hypothetical protein HY562_12805 [Ignavibacteriales bacterium]|nr:hypothetical protein [Ignavibacteriales bacterium]